MSDFVPVLLKRKAVAAMLSCHINHIKNLVKQGALKEIHISNRAPRITRESVEKLIAGK